MSNNYIIANGTNCRKQIKLILTMRKNEYYGKLFRMFQKIHTMQLAGFFFVLSKIDPRIKKFKMADKLRVRRELLDANFDGYKLSLETLPTYTCKFDNGRPITSFYILKLN